MKYSFALTFCAAAGLASAHTYTDEANDLYIRNEDLQPSLRIHHLEHPHSQHLFRREGQRKSWLHAKPSWPNGGPPASLMRASTSSRGSSQSASSSGSQKPLIRPEMRIQEAPPRKPEYGIQEAPEHGIQPVPASAGKTASAARGVPAAAHAGSDPVSAASGAAGKEKNSRIKAWLGGGKSKAGKSGVSPSDIGSSGESASSRKSWFGRGGKTSSSPSSSASDSGSEDPGSPTSPRKKSWFGSSGVARSGASSSASSVVSSLGTPGGKNWFGRLKKGPGSIASGGGGSSIGRASMESSGTTSSTHSHPGVRPQGPVGGGEYVFPEERT